MARHSPDGWVLFEEGSILAASSSLLTPGNFDKLAQYYAYTRSLGLPADLARQDVEQAWLRSAHAEHWNRKFIGWTESILGGIAAGASAVVLVSMAEHPSEPEPSFVPAFSGFLAIELAALALGVSWVASDGPIESALHAYEGSAGHTVRPSSLSDIAPRLSLGQGGGILGIGGRF